MPCLKFSRNVEIAYAHASSSLGARIREQHHRFIDRRSLEEEQEEEEDQGVPLFCSALQASFAGPEEECSCEEFSGGSFGLTCQDQCLYCDAEGFSCGSFVSSFNITGAADLLNFLPVDFSFTFQYDGAAGLHERITIAYHDCNDDVFCGGCSVFVNDTECNSCSSCAGNNTANGFIVDCDNVAFVNSSFSFCEDTAIIPPGVFQAFNYDIVSCDDPLPPLQPANDNCTDAIMLQEGETFVWSAYGATTSDSFPTCNLVESQSNGVWFIFEGSGSPMLISTCGDAELGVFATRADTTVSVYEGSDCSQLQCVSTYYQDLSCGGLYYGGTAFSMDTNPGTSYYVHVANKYGDYPGQFALSLTEYMQPANNECSSAEDLLIDNGPVPGAIRREGSNGETSPCGAFLVEGSGMAWYEFTPTQDASLRASTCSYGTIGVATELTIVSGGCDDQICMAESETFSYYQGCGEGGTIVDFDVVADGSVYFISVWGPMMSDLGLFELELRTLDPPSNDNCDNSIEIFLDTPVIGTLQDATMSIDEQDSSCTLAYGSLVGGVWYSFMGTGETFKVEVCSDQEIFVSAYDGTCNGSLGCVGAHSYSTPKSCSMYGAATSPIETEEGEAYSILVSSYTVTSNVTFQLLARKSTPPPNDECSAALELSVNAESLIVGNTDDAIYQESSLECEYASQSPALWYLVRGTGGIIKADTCSGNTNFDTVISIFEGPCGENSFCLAANDDGCSSLSSSVTWDTEIGMDYYVRVSGLGDGQVGEFGLRISSFEPAENDSCSGALELIVNSPRQSSLSGASPDEQDVADCLYDTSTPSLWYYIDGTGTALEISACDPGGTSVNGRMQILKGSSCFFGQTCELFASDYSCPYGFSGNAKFFAEDGERYYVLFLGFDETSEGNGSNFTILATELEPEINDQCSGAISISRVGVETPGSNRRALPDNTTCNQNEFYAYEGAPSGVWYSFEGTGRPMAASTCSKDLNFDTSIKVFVGECDNLACLATSRASYDSDCEETFYGSSRAVFQTEVGVSYFILVSGDYSSAVGEFGLTIYEADVPSNDLCSNATQILPDMGAIAGSTLNATSSPPLPQNPHNQSSSFGCTYVPATSGVWYSFFGTGDVYQLVVCSSQGIFDRGFDPAISITSGSCDQQQCITTAAYNFESCGNGGVGAIVVIRTVVDVQYYAFVHGAYEEAKGDFEIAVTTFEAASNDICAEAVTIVPNNGTIFASTAAATDSGVQGCYGNVEFGDDAVALDDDAEVTAVPVFDVENENNNNGNGDFANNDGSFVEDSSQQGSRSPDLWYRVEGTGGPLIASMCGPATTYDSQIEVYEALDGSCNAIVCVDSNDDYCGTASRVEWSSSTGVLYLIRIFGFSESRGSFQLDVTTPLPPEADTCESAEMLDSGVGMQSVSGSTSAATSTIKSDCANNSTSLGPDIWYVTLGVGEAITVSTCSPSTSFETTLSVYTGSCDSLSCVVGNNDTSSCIWSSTSSQVSFFGEVGVLYYIVVRGSDFSSGDFELTLTVGEPVISPNNLCSNPIVLEIGESISGTTNQGATPTVGQAIPFCFNVDSRDLWYKVIGNGELLTASTCGLDTNFDTRLDVYIAENESSCDVLSCLSTNDDACGSASSEVEWQSFLGEVYIIRVYGFSETSFGDFELSISSRAVTFDEVSDECETAVPLSPYSEVYGTTIGATPDPLLASCGEATSVVSGGVWYQVIGDGNTLTATTCTPRTNFDTQISVYTGSCDGDNMLSMALMQCVNGNDQFCADQSSVEWSTEPGVIYYVVVSTFR